MAAAAKEKLSPAQVKLVELLDDSGTPPEAAAYICAKLCGGSIATLAAFLKTEQDIEVKIVQPLEGEGTKLRETCFAWLEDTDMDVARAALLVLYQDAHALRKHQLAVTAAPPPVGPLAAVGPAAAPQAPSENSLLHNGKRTLANGAWERQIERYESRWNPRRTFPQELIFGAETVLARVLYEHEQSKKYEPLLLHEIISSRAFTSAGSVNQHAAKSGDFKSLGLRAGALSIEDEAQPLGLKGSWSIADALEANKWALVFVGHGDDDSLRPTFANLLALARAHPNHLERFKAAHDCQFWHVCMAMRRGRSLIDAASEFLCEKELDKAFEKTSHRGRSPSRRGGRGGRRSISRRGRSRSNRRGNYDRGNKGKGRGGNGRDDRDDRRGGPPNPKGGGKRGDGRDDRGGNGSYKRGGNGRDDRGGGGRNRGASRGRDTEDTVCENYQRGKCLAKNCPRGFNHVCKTCGRKGHGAFHPVKCNRSR